MRRVTYIHRHLVNAEGRPMKSKSFLPKFLPLCLAPLAALSTACSSEAEPGNEPDPAPATNPWNGQTYMLDVTERDWSEPRGIGSEIDLFVPNFLLKIEGESPDTFNVMVATAKADGSQDTCNLTSMVSAAKNTDGAVAIGPTEFPLHIQHVDEPDIAVDGPIYDFTITNVLPNGGATSDMGELVATMDFRDIYRLFTLIVNPTPDSVCSALGDSYEPCAPCPNDGEPYCLTVKAIYLGATPTTTVIEPIAQLDPSCTPPTPQ